MALLTLHDIGLGYGGQTLFENVRLRINAGERVCLVGRNGVGKSTLLKIIAGDLTPDQGEIRRQPGAEIAALPQEVPQRLSGRVYDVVISGLGRSSAALAEYHRVSRQLAEQGSEALLAELGSIQQRLEADGGWQLFQRTEAAISQMDLDAEAEVETLSAGLKRRVLLARALVQSPDLLLLDEPTNHLDVESIRWLEEELLRLRCALLFITHDRAFLRRLATRIVEIDRGRLFDWPGDYDTYLRRKEEELAAEATRQELFDKKLAQEESWIRQGIKARRTRNEGRVRRLETMRSERLQRRQQIGKARIQVQEAERSGKKVIRARDLHFAFEGQPAIVDGFSINIQRGDRIGILGPNGIGKTTFLRLLLGELEPQAGEVEHGTKLEVAYFDQLRDQLDEEKSTQDNVAGGREYLSFDGKRRHVISYLQDFLFAPDRARSPVAQLSGGERHRLLLAKLFTQPSNVLVLDEPTNDLDVETLELLEERLLDYGGTVLTVSHDRAFLNNVVTSIVAFEGQGRVFEYVGGYDDWLRQRRPVDEPSRKPESRAAAPLPKPASERPPKLSYREKNELEALPGKIESLEEEQQTLHEQLNDPAFYQRPHDEIAAAADRLKIFESELESAYDRWAELQEQDEQSRRPVER